MEAFSVTVEFFWDIKKPHKNNFATTMRTVKNYFSGNF